MASMGIVWDRTTLFLAERSAAIAPIALAAFFVPVSVSGNFESVRSSLGPSGAMALGLAGIVLAIVQIWGSLAVTALALEPAPAAGPAEAGRVGLRRLVPTLLVSLLLFLIAGLLALPIFVALALGGVDMMALSTGAFVPADIDPRAAGFSALYGLVLLLVLLFVGARLALTTPVIVQERRSLASIGRSWSMTRGITWRLVGVILLYAIVSWVAQLAALTVFGSVFRLLIGGADEGLTLAGVLTSIVVAAVQTVFLVIAPVFLAKLYAMQINRPGTPRPADPA